MSYLNKVHLGIDALGELGQELALASIHKPLIVTDPGLLASGVIEQVMQRCPNQPAVFSQTPSNPTEEAVEQAVSAYQQNGCDGLIAVGGGSPIDLAKAVALLVTHGGALGDYLISSGGDGKIKSHVAPFIAIPTTAGTGSEVGRSAVITLRKGGKVGIRSPHLLPKATIADPVLTQSLPPMLTAATGMDAFTHCVEAYLSPVENPVAEAIALRGAQLAFDFVERATLNGKHDLEARKQMMSASIMGGLAFQKGLGAVHALSHQLGALKAVSLHHGTLNAVLLPAVLRFNADAIAEKVILLEKALQLENGTRLDDAISALNRRLGLPQRLSEMGVMREWLDAIAELAPGDPTAATNPKPMGVADFRRVLDDAF